MGNFYWIGDSGNWHNAAHWAATSGGAGGAGIPTASDDVFFDANSFSTSGQIVTIDSANIAHCHNLNFTGVLHNPTLRFSALTTGGNANIQVEGNITFATGVILDFQGVVNTSPLTNASFLIKPVNDITIDAKGIDIPIYVEIRNVSGSLKSIDLASDLSCSVGIDLDVNGSSDVNFTTNNHAISAGFIFIGNGSSAVVTFDAGSSVITLIGFIQTVPFPRILNGFNFNDTHQIFTDTASVINLNYNPDVTNFENWDIGLKGQAIGEVKTGGVSSGANPYLFFDATESSPGSTIRKLTFQPDDFITFVGGGVSEDGTFLLTEIDANGSSGHPITFRSYDAGLQFTISATTVSVSYIDVKDSVAAGTIPFVDSGGTDSGNNVNWTFATPTPAPAEVIDSSDITLDEATIQGDISDTTGVDEFGVVWDTNPDPTISDSHVPVFSVIGPFFVDITGLIPGQTYYVRTYSKSGATYNYGAIQIIVTTPVISPVALPATDNLIGPYQLEILDGNDAIIANFTGYAANLAFSMTRNRAEEISFSLPLFTLEQLCTALHMTSADILATGINTVRIKRKNTIILAGQLDYWDTDFSNPTSPLVNVRAHGWLSLLSYRLFSGEYTSQDANYIIRDMITQTQALTNGDFNMTLGSSASGTNSYTDKKFENKNISDAMIEFSEEADGLDFAFTWDKIVNLYWPGIGSVRQDILFTYPGNMRSLNVSSDSTKIVNSLLARGKGNADANISTIINDPTSQALYKLRTSVKDFPDMDADQLINSASSEVAFYKNPLVLHSLEYDGANPACPEIGTFSLGDQVRIIVSGIPLFANMLNDFFVIDKIAVTINSNGVEVIQLDFNNAP